MPPVADRAHDRLLSPPAPPGRAGTSSRSSATSPSATRPPRGRSSRRSGRLTTLRAHPEAGRRYAPEHTAFAGVRALPIPGFPDHLIFCRYDGTTVEVIRVIHGARDILATLDREH